MYANFDTACASATIDSMGIGPAGPWYADIKDYLELLGERVSDELAEDRLLMAFTGATGSEIWA